MDNTEGHVPGHVPVLMQNLGLNRLDQFLRPDLSEPGRRQMLSQQSQRRQLQPYGIFSLIPCIISLARILSPAMPLQPGNTLDSAWSWRRDPAADRQP